MQVLYLMSSFIIVYTINSIPNMNGIKIKKTLVDLWTCMSFSSRIANEAPSKQNSTPVSMTLMYSLAYGLVRQWMVRTDRARNTCINWGRDRERNYIVVGCTTYHNDRHWSDWYQQIDSGKWQPPPNVPHSMPQEPTIWLDASSEGIGKMEMFLQIQYIINALIHTYHLLEDCRCIPIWLLELQYQKWTKRHILWLSPQVWWDYVLYHHCSWIPTCIGNIHNINAKCM